MDTDHSMLLRPDVSEHLREMHPGSSDLLAVELLCAMKRNMATVWDHDGNIKLANDFMACGYGFSSPLDMLGKNIADLTPPQWAAERIGIARRSVELEKPISLLEINNGYRINIRFIPVQFDHMNLAPPDILIVIEQITRGIFNHIMSDKYPEMTMQPEYHSLGMFDVLSKREIEVLALMGEGLRAKEIAKRLFRSVSTIENHRDNIGQKLGIKDRAVLLTVAEKAVFQLDDANRKRVNFERAVPIQEQISAHMDSTYKEK